MMNALGTVTNPQAVVITTKPATATEQKPRIEGLPFLKYSINGQTKLATAAAIVVVTKALAPTLSAASAEPALNPYHPTQSMPVPIEHNTMLCGGIAVLPNPLRGPKTKQRISALQPELM